MYRCAHPTRAAALALEQDMAVAPRAYSALIWDPPTPRRRPLFGLKKHSAFVHFGFYIKTNPMTLFLLYVLRFFSLICGSLSGAELFSSYLFVL